MTEKPTPQDLTIFRFLTRITASHFVTSPSYYVGRPVRTRVANVQTRRSDFSSPDVLSPQVYWHQSLPVDYEFFNSRKPKPDIGPVPQERPSIQISILCPTYKPLPGFRKSPVSVHPFHNSRRPCTKPRMKFSFRYPGKQKDARPEK